MIACILAAGRGTRLGARGEETPKGFLRVGELPIIEESLQQLEAHGIRKTVIVTGHLSDYYKDWARDRSDRVTLVHNPDFADSGSLYSLWCAREELQEPYLLLESDLIYESRALSVCLDDGRDSLVLVSGPTQADDEVWVETEGEQLVAMSKNRSDLGTEVMGEFVGVCKIGTEVHGALIHYAESVFKESRHKDYETDGLVQAASKVPLACRLISDLAWAEIDTAEHLERARNTVYPRLRQG